MTWLLPAGSYLAVLVVTVLVATRGRPKSLLGRASGQDVRDFEPPDAVQKLVIVLYPLLLAFVAAIIWVVLWFGLYAVN